MDIFNQKHVLFDIDVKNQMDAFKKIAKLAKQLKVIDDEQNLIDGFVRREKVSTTGMKDSFAIPHAMSANIKKPAIIAARFKKGVDWKAIDNNPVKFAIAILIPEKNLGDLHMEYLARISTGLMDENFCKKLLTTKSKQTVTKLITDAIDEKNTDIKIIKASKNEKPKQVDKSKPLVIGVSACATGIVHTFMTREALENAGKELNVNVHIETEGQNGREHALTDELIKKADYVIIAADIGVETDRFIGKKIFFCGTHNAIDDPTTTLQTAMKKAVIWQGQGGGGQKTQAISLGGKKQNPFMKHFLSGVSHMIPVLVFSGIVYAIINAICTGIYGTNIPPADSPMWYAMQVANVGFTFFIGIMGAYIAESIAGRSAFAPGLIASFVAGSTSLYWYWPGIPKEVSITLFQSTGSITISNISLGIIAAIMMGFAAGGIVKWINTWKVKQAIRPIISIIFVPVVVTSVLVFPFVFLLSGILGCMMNYIGAGIAYAGSIPGVNFLIGFLLGAMIGFDMGGPINKIAVSTATCLILVDPRFMGACAAAIPVAPLGCGLAAVIFRKTFNEPDDLKNGATAIGLGFMGISEGAIPFFAKRPKQTVIANVTASAIAGGLAFMFFVGGHVAMWGGPLIAFCLGVYADPGDLHTFIPAIFGGGSDGTASTPMKYISILWYFVAIIGASIIHMFVYWAVVKGSKGRKDLSKKENKQTKKKVKPAATKINRINKFLINAHASFKLNFPI